MVETVFGRNWAGRIARDGRVDRFGRHFAADHRRRRRSSVAVRLQKPLSETRQRAGRRTSKM